MNMLWGFMQQDRYVEAVRRERELRRPASMRGEDHCIRCGWCCFGRTCVPTPEEVEQIAAHLGMTVREMVEKYMVADSWCGHYFLRWANTAQTDILGSYLTADRSFDLGDCILFDKEKGCLIYDVLPEDARRAGCLSNHSGDGRTATKSWQGEEHIRRLCPWIVLDDYLDDDPWDDDDW